MKLNWGTGIAITLFLFAGLMTTMVYKATQQRFDLVSENYYEEELNYQEVINQKSNSLKLKDKARIVRTEEGFALEFPDDFKGKNKSFSALMYCEKDARMDFEWDEKNLLINKSIIPFTRFRDGRWIAKVKLNCEGIDYYFEPEIIL
tara:strand:- start:2037 stop:2477 length:441 start_codon:yes stop_codon:yes gene_type:complete